MNQQITSPESFFGFQLGSDQKMARWNQIVDYFRLLEEQSDKIQVIDMGPLHRGAPVPVRDYFLTGESGEFGTPPRGERPNQRSAGNIGGNDKLARGCREGDYSSVHGAARDRDWQHTDGIGVGLRSDHANR